MTIHAHQEKMLIIITVNHQARIAAQNEKRRCEQRKQQLINQCNTRVNNNNRNAANFEIRQAQSKVNQYCY